MVTRCLTLLFVFALWLFTYSQVVAQSRTDLVCWANPAQVIDCPQEYRARVFPCMSGGHPGFNPDHVCRQICGANEGPRCKVTGGPGGGGGQCGYRAARVECFN